jgi:hypothetical protein
MKLIVGFGLFPVFLVGTFTRHTETLMNTVLPICVHIHVEHTILTYESYSVTLHWDEASAGLDNFQ